MLAIPVDLDDPSKTREELDVVSSDVNESEAFSGPEEEGTIDKGKIESVVAEDTVERLSGDSKSGDGSDGPTTEAVSETVDKSSSGKDMKSAVGSSSSSEFEYLSRLRKEEFSRIIQEAEEHELEEPIEAEAIAALKAASCNVCYKKKYYDVLNDRCVFFPSVARTIVDYSLIEDAERLYYNGEEEFPMEYTAGLRAVASTLAAADDLDYDYMDMLAIPVDLDDPSKTREELDVVSSDVNESEAFSGPEEEGTIDKGKIESVVAEDTVERLSGDSKSGDGSDGPTTEAVSETVDKSSSGKDMKSAVGSSRLRKEEFSRIIQEAEEHELEEPIEAEAIAALKAASCNVCYKKKYYDVLNDRCVFFPSVARTIVDYSLIEDAERLYYNGEEEFPMEYTAGLRAVASTLAAADDLDYDYMDMLAIPVDLDDPSKTREELDVVSSDVNESEAFSGPEEEGTIDKGKIESVVAEDTDERLSGDSKSCGESEGSTSTSPDDDRVPSSEGIEPIDTADSHQKTGATVISSVDYLADKVLKPALFDEQSENGEDGKTGFRSEDSDEGDSSLDSDEDLPREEDSSLEKRSALIENVADQKGQPAGVPDHLVALNQPKLLGLEDSRSSIKSHEVFDLTSDMSPREKPLLTAALKAMALTKMNASLSALEITRTEVIAEHDLSRSVPDHLILLNQPKSLETMDRDSIRSIEVFDSPSKDLKPDKPLLAAALKAKSDQMAKSFSALEGLSPIRDSGRGDLSKSVPSHLFMINQPKFVDAGDSDSIEELELFDPAPEPPVDDPDFIPNKPLLSAALKAKKEQLSKSFSVGDDTFLLADKESINHVFSKSVPNNLVAMEEATGEDEWRSNLVASDEFVDTLYPDSSGVLAATVPASGGEMKPDDALKDIQRDATPKRKKNQGVGFGGRLLQDAITLKENSLNEGGGETGNIDAENDHAFPLKKVIHADVVESKSRACATHNGIIDPTTDASDAGAAGAVETSYRFSNQERMSWWGANGKRLVEAQFNPSFESHRITLTESLAEHNRSVMEAISAARETPFSSASGNEAVGMTPNKIDVVVSTASDSLSQKRRKADESRQRAMLIQNEGLPPEESELNGENGDGKILHRSTFIQARESLQRRVEAAEEPVDSFKQARDSLQNRVEASKETGNTHVSMTGNTRALEWAQATSHQPDEITTASSNVGNVKVGLVSDRLDWWRKNGKRLVNEKLSMSLSTAVPKGGNLDVSTIGAEATADDRGRAYLDNDLVPPKLGGTSADSPSRREILAEKRRQIVEARKALKEKGKEDGDRLSSTDEGVHLYHANDSKEAEERKKIREMEAHRLAERTKQARESRLARENELGGAPEKGHRTVESNALTNVGIALGRSPSDGPKSAEPKLLVLISKTPGVVKQRINQDRAMAMLKGKFQMADMEQVDGSDPASKDQRNRLFDISGITGCYPQFFLKRDENSVAYLGDFNWIERANETGALSKKNIFGSSDLTHKEVPSHLRARDEATHSVQAKKSVSSTILSPMIRETDRLSGFIRRYENKLETVCKSLLAVASEDNDNKEEILSAKELPLPEMLDFIVQQEWYNAQSSTSVNSLGQPKLLFSRSGMGQSTNKSNQDAAKETTTDKGGKSNDNIYTITAVGKAFIDMDGPLHADVGRFLAHLNGASQGMKRTVMLENW
eukprot:CAMPEP_0178782662 /NCGR_PEP_ID=MMETSP0745-20121128/3269_1 /TAXON_ID=913974 /ORGANISM="Nitzschia punctata, Strain CCMP561" /LENGTH=1672 /DNA_ID=CAMNT_0020440117 /DNA_START=1 /DNA_END=5016 /DNA_ORIENTATION=-